MMPTEKGSFQLFRFAGITVFLHWSWFIVAIYEIQDRATKYSSYTWNAAEYLALFAIVLMHEFGHSLACRQVGGRAERIILWPLGGVAYVEPPQRPGAILWSVAAGPLVNVILLPITFGLALLSSMNGWETSMPDAAAFVTTLLYMNGILLLFNLLPVYPLDGGQILRSLLWFVLGRGHSLMVTTVLGFVGVGGLVLFAIYAHSFWIGLMAAFVLMNCWSGFQQARALSRIDKLPRHAGLACPACKSSPPTGLFWSCGNCRAPFDPFVTGGLCPHCSARFDVTRCPDCGAMHPIAAYAAPPVINV